MGTYKYLVPKGTAPGTVLELAGSDYECFASRPYRNRKGELSAVLYWVSRCNHCGEQYTFKTGPGYFSYSANCEVCKLDKHPSHLRGLKLKGGRK